MGRFNIGTRHPYPPNPNAEIHKIAQPAATHFTRITCREAECRAFRFGFNTTVPVGSPQDLYIRHHSGKAFKEEVVAGMVTFFIQPGQEFWDGAPDHQHKRRLGRDPLLIHRPARGDARRMEVNEFTDSMNENAHQLNQRRQRG